MSEHSKIAQQSIAARACSGAPLLVVGYESVGVHDGRAALAVADIAAERERLAEGGPALARKAVPRRSKGSAR